MKKVIILSIMLFCFLPFLGCAKASDLKNNQNKNYNTFNTPEGWSVNYPLTWDRVEQNFITESSTGKTVQFYTTSSTKEELEKRIDSEIQRKLNAPEASNTLKEKLQVTQKEKLTYYTYTIASKMETKEYLLKNTIIFDGQKAYEFRTQMPPVTLSEYSDIINSFIKKE